MKHIKNNFFDIYYYDELSDSDLKNIINGEPVRKSHYEWAKLYFASNRDFNIKDVLFDSERFNQEVDKDCCFYTYPLAGAFTRFLVEKYGQDTYLNFYKNASKENLTLLYGNYDLILAEFENYVVR